MKSSFFVYILISFIGGSRTCFANSKDASVNRAYELLLSKSRAEALAHLAPQAKKKGNKTVLEAYEDIGRTFLSETTQQLYEQSVSLEKGDLQAAIGKLNSAIELEPDHLQLILLRSRFLIASGQCPQALTDLNLKSSIYDFIGDFNLAVTQAQTCLGDQSNRLDSRGRPLQIHWKTLEVEKLYKQKQFLKAKEIASEIVRLDGNFPESYYWLALLQKALKLDFVGPAQKYATLCRNLQPKARRNYLYEPFLCRRLAELNVAIPGNL